MRKIFLQIACAAFLFASLAHGQTYERAALWQKEIDAFAEIDRKQTAPANAVLFVGSSTIRGWRTLRADFPGLAFVNRGFGGAHLEDVNFYFERIVAAHRAKKVVLYAGENDIAAGKTADRVFGDFVIFAELLRKNSPKTELIFVSVKPSPARMKFWAEMKRANSLIENEIKRRERAKFVDVSAAMLESAETPKPEIYQADGIHLNEKGYRIWREALSKHLK